MKRSPHGTVSRARWAAIGAAVAVSLGVGGVAVTNAIVSTGEKAVFIPITPCRLFDLRPAPDQVGTRADPLGPGETYTEKVRGINGNCNIPADATAVAMNVTAVGGTADSFLTIWPSGVTRPVASNLNWVPGAPPTPNKVDVKLSDDGWIDLFNLAGHVSVLADVVGYYADHNHDDRYYTKAEIDAKLSSDIVMTHGLFFFQNGGFGVGVVEIANSLSLSELTSTGPGIADFQLVGPKSQSGVAFGLKSVTYCMEAAVGGASVAVARVAGSAPAFVPKFDNTVRTTAGCYTVTVNDRVSTSFTLGLELMGAGTIRVTGVTSTWAPVSLIPATAP